MATHQETLWRIEQLVERAVQALQQGDYAGPLNARVRELPSLRSIRLYTTLGLLDRPILKGRTGYYGQRHLIQLVAIKRLQAEGLSLSEIQQRLLGLPDETLAEIAKVPPHLLRPEVSHPTTANGHSRRQTAFWKTMPTVSEALSEAEATPIPVRHWQSLELAEGVHLLIETKEPLSAESVQELLHSALPLLRTLRRLSVTQNKR